MKTNLMVKEEFRSSGEEERLRLLKALVEQALRASEAGAEAAWP